MTIHFFLSYASYVKLLYIHILTLLRYLNSNRSINTHKEIKCGKLLKQQNKLTKKCKNLTCEQFLFLLLIFCVKQSIMSVLLSTKLNYTKSETLYRVFIKYCVFI